MINEALFPQPWIDEAEPIFEESPITTYRIEDLPQAKQDQLKACKGHRNKRFKSFNIKRKGLKK
jgi:hypothetical protein